LALTAVIGGSFSRLGYGARIAAVAFAALVVRVAGFGAQAAAAATPGMNLAQYLIPLGATAVALVMLFAHHPQRRLELAEVPA
jgi:lipopolysaccharide export system permease protein